MPVIPNMGTASLFIFRHTFKIYVERCAIMFIDLIVVVLILIGVIVGYLRGLFRMIGSIASIVIAWVLALLFAGSVATFAFDNWIAPPMTDAVQAQIDEFGAEETIQGIYDTVSNIQSSINFDEVGKQVGKVGTQIGDTLSGLNIELPSLDDISPMDNQDVLDKLTGTTEGEMLVEQYENISSFFGDLAPTISNFVAENVDLNALGGLTGYVQATGADSVAAPLVALFRTPAIAILTPICFALIALLGTVILNIVLGIIFDILDKSSTINSLQKLGGVIIGVVIALGISVLGILVLRFCVPETENFYKYMEASVSMQVVEWGESQLIAMGESKVLETSADVK